MQNTDLSSWQHSHTFKQDQKRPGESRTLIVILITFLMMIVEIIAGIAYGSMALLADGLHMASHTIALGISYFAYRYARQFANDPRFSFGTGKVNTLAGYTGAILLAGFAFVMIWESAHRLISPVSISFDQAIWVAIAGLIVNGISVFILGVHSHDHTHEDGHVHEHEHSHSHDHHEDHNLRSAYLHVLADALTSLLAIVALVVGKYYGASWLDPVMGFVGAVLVARWSWGLLKTTSTILLDHQAPEKMRQTIVEIIESDNGKVVDLHVWATGPNIYCGVIAIVVEFPESPEYYKSLIKKQFEIEHLSVEVHSLQVA
ncbi:MAG: CDF family Co(II)/Ni(II) efflux transporter DmeF [Cellvibrionaceae bacterium]